MITRPGKRERRPGLSFALHLSTQGRWPSSEYPEEFRLGPLNRSPVPFLATANDIAGRLGPVELFALVRGLLHRESDPALERGKVCLPLDRGRCIIDRLIPCLRDERGAISRRRKYRSRHTTR